MRPFIPDAHQILDLRKTAAKAGDEYMVDMCDCTLYGLTEGHDKQTLRALAVVTREIVKAKR